MAAGSPGATGTGAGAAASGLRLLPAGVLLLLPSGGLLPFAGASGTGPGHHPPSDSGSQGPGFGAVPRGC